MPPPLSPPPVPPIAGQALTARGTVPGQGFAWDGSLRARTLSAPNIYTGTSAPTTTNPPFPRLGDYYIVVSAAGGVYLCTVGGSPATWVLLTLSGGHLVGSGAAPTLGALQTNITAQSITGVDAAMTVSVTTGAVAPVLGAAIALVTFATTYAPLSPRGSATSSGGGSAGFAFQARSATGFTLTSADLAMQALTTYTADLLWVGA